MKKENFVPSFLNTSWKLWRFEETGRLSAPSEADEDKATSA